MTVLTKEDLQREMSDLMTVEEVAAALQYNRQHVRLLARNGVLPARKRRHQWLFKPIDVRNFIANTDNAEGETYEQSDSGIQEF